jgi:hypothetical protein
MPTGPRGERRPADVIGAAVMIARIANGQIIEHPKLKPRRVRSGHASAGLALTAYRPNIGARSHGKFHQNIGGGNG